MKTFKQFGIDKQARQSYQPFALLISSILISLLMAAPGHTKTEESVSRGSTIAIITTRGPNDPFWGMVEDIMEAACSQFNIKLRRYHADSNRLNMLKTLEQEAKRVDRADVIVFPNYLKTAASMVKRAEELNQPIFIFNSGISSEKAQEIGEPREKYRFFLGEMLPDDKHAGFLLTQILHKRALQYSDKPLMAAVSGHSADTAAIERTKGLNQYLTTHTNIELTQQVAADWEKEKASKIFLKLYKRYPKILIAWSASDHMATGILEAKAKLNTDTPLFTGGVDWSLASIQLVKEGKQTTSVGGHVFEGVWVAALIHDYLHGKDFAEISLAFNSPMTAITSENVDAYQRVLNKDNWSKLDFKVFSRVLSKEKEYSFSLDTLQKQLTPE